FIDPLPLQYNFVGNRAEIVGRQAGASITPPAIFALSVNESLTEASRARSKTGARSAAADARPALDVLPS
ncbi:hypothetical protein RF094_23130, partial [Serratia marcescens]|nr:hypothetical protein [Serratia marcescens]